MEDNNDKGFLGDNDNDIEDKISKIKKEFINEKGLTDKQKENMLKELQAETNKTLREISEKFDVWYGNNRDYLMREYIGEHQKEFRDFCGKIFMEDEDKEEKEEVSDKDLGL